MTTNAMSCELFTDSLMAYLEHETDDAMRAAIERHAVTCVECGALLADLRKLRVDASNLPELTPSRDLWSGIAARIETPVVALDARRGQDVRRTTRAVVRRALFAASIVGAGAIGYFAASRRAPATVAPAVATVQPTVQPETVYRIASPAQDSAARLTQRVASTALSGVVSDAPEAPAVTTPTARTPVVPVSDVANVVANMSRDYDREIVRLRALIEQRRNQMDPVTVAIIEKNLQVIDAAIAECKKAIARDPASRFLIESLNQSFQTKVELMRTAALLPART